MYVGFRENSMAFVGALRQLEGSLAPSTPNTVDDVNPALPTIRNIPEFP